MAEICRALLHSGMAVNLVFAPGAATVAKVKADRIARPTKASFFSIREYPMFRYAFSTP